MWTIFLSKNEPLISAYAMVAFDAHMGAKSNLKAICMWNIHDFPTYDLFIVCVTKRQVGCSPCGVATKFQSSNFFLKMVYCGTHRYSPWSHPYRQAKMAFNGKTKLRVAPIRVSATSTIESIEEWETCLAIL